MDLLHERVATLKTENESLKAHLAQAKQQGGILHEQLVHSKVQQVSSQAPLQCSMIFNLICIGWPSASSSGELLACPQQPFC